ncbi:hypothetical protein [Bradyrhizobium sp. YR681]|uniref:hypothetical protein n=1 Tax=Bradyrhizobium sp. YR681 TaxID=1144344 RepID=UPI0003092537|nr:hypothetical protein [Bradyrhizobium sp. YR681]
MRWLNLFGDDCGDSSVSRPWRGRIRSGEPTPPDRDGRITFHALLRVATNGYNDSFEKPVVVVHDLPDRIPFGRLLD